MKKSSRSIERPSVQFAFHLGSCQASPTLSSEHQKVGCMVRTEPVSPEDSGWRLYATSEEKEVISSLETLQLSDVLIFDPGILPYLGMAVGTTLIRIPGIDHFELIKNY